MSKYTTKQFAKKIRDKYPGAYDDLRDNQLVNLWLEKYPNDRHFISIDEDEGYEEEEFDDEDDNSNKYKKNMSTESNSFTWLLVIIAAAVLFFTNPSLEKHRNVTATEAMSIFKESKVFGIIKSFTLGKGDELLMSSIKGGIHRNNYFLFSLTTLKSSDDNDSKIIGIGILGMVYIFDDAKQEFKSQIESYDSAAGLFLGS